MFGANRRCPQSHPTSTAGASGAKGDTMRRVLQWGSAGILAVALVAPSCAQPSQTSANVSPAAAAPAPVMPDLAPTLSQVEKASKATVTALGNIQIDHWKVNADGKKEATHNAQS